MTKFNALDWFAMFLVVVGGLNWGLVGAYGFDVVEFLFGDMTALSRTVYVIIGVAAVYFAVVGCRFCKK